MTFKSNLEAALPLLKAAKVVGLIEPINPYSVPNYNMDNYEDAVQLVKDLDSPWLRLQLDIFHLQQIKGNITRNIKDLLPIVGHIQVCDKKTSFSLIKTTLLRSIEMFTRFLV